MITSFRALSVAAKSGAISHFEQESKHFAPFLFSLFKYQPRVYECIVYISHKTIGGALTAFTSGFHLWSSRSLGSWTRFAYCKCIRCVSQPIQSQFTKTSISLLTRTLTLVGLSMQNVYNILYTLLSDKSRAKPHINKHPGSDAAVSL